MRHIPLVMLLAFLTAGAFMTACNGVKKTGQPALTEGDGKTSEVATLASSLPALETSPTPTGSSMVSTLMTNSPLPTALPDPTVSPVSCNMVTGACIESGHFLLDRPITLPGRVTVDPTYTYGTTQGGSRPPHHGVEFYNASGTPVLAAADGEVIVAGDDRQTNYGLSPNTYGNLIILEHHFPGIDQPVYTVYGHLSEVEVQVGESVRSGQEIGKVGATGEAIGSHLHFEVRLGENDYDSDRNPVLWLKPLVGSDDRPFGVIAGRLTDAQGNLIDTQNLNVQFFPDSSGPQAAAYPVETYASDTHPVGSDDLWKENFTVDDLPAGHYRLSLIRHGILYERWVDVEPGKVTVFVFQTDR